MDISRDDILEKYLQNRYAFNPKALTRLEILDVKRLAREKRSDYGIAPIGTDIFRYISERETELYFECESFENPDLDALIYLPNPKKETAFIVLNSSQPLMNQIFATAHEYYHYIENFDAMRSRPQVCSLSLSKDKFEHRANRFAAEFLLPEEALRNHIDKWLALMNYNEVSEGSISDIASLCYVLTIRYCIPLKAVLIRLYEENYIRDIESYLSNYDFIKTAFKEQTTNYSKQAQELLNNDNPYIDEIMYRLIPKAFKQGFLSIDELEEEIAVLNLNRAAFDELFATALDEDDDEEINEDLRLALSSKLSGRVHEDEEENNSGS